MRKTPEELLIRGRFLLFPSLIANPKHANMIPFEGSATFLRFNVIAGRCETSLSLFLWIIWIPLPSFSSPLSQSLNLLINDVWRYTFPQWVFLGVIILLLLFLVWSLPDSHSLV